MSTSYHRPTHTFEEGAFNSTQVRLYGLYKTDQIKTKNGHIKLGNFSITIKLDKGGNGEIPNIDVDSIKIQKQNKSPAIFMVLSVASDDDNSEDQYTHKIIRSIGIIYGYAYEGHCYELPKPAIMLLPVKPEKRTPADDCGYDEKFGEGYRVWVVDKLNECEVIEFNSGFVEQLVLEANTPGRRSPSTYRATMQLAHRSGRLTD